MWKDRRFSMKIKDSDFNNIKRTINTLKKVGSKP